MVRSTYLLAAAASLASFATAADAPIACDLGNPCPEHVPCCSRKSSSLSLPANCSVDIETEVNSILTSE